MRLKPTLRHFRVSIDVDVVAQDRESAEHLATILFELLRGRWWIKEVLPNGIEERMPLKPTIEGE